MISTEQALANYKTKFKEYIEWHEKTYKEYTEINNVKMEEVELMSMFGGGDYRKIQELSKGLWSIQEALEISKEEDKVIEEEIIEELKKEGKYFSDSI